MEDKMQIEGLMKEYADVLLQMSVERAYPAFNTDAWTKETKLIDDSRALASILRLRKKAMDELKKADNEDYRYITFKIQLDRLFDQFKTEEEVVKRLKQRRETMEKGILE